MKMKSNIQLLFVVICLILYYRSVGASLPRIQCSSNSIDDFPCISLSEDSIIHVNDQCKSTNMFLEDLSNILKKISLSNSSLRLEGQSSSRNVTKNDCHRQNCLDYKQEIKCTSDHFCETNQYCNLSQGTCIYRFIRACSIDRDCNKGDYCQSGSCITYATAQAGSILESNDQLYKLGSPTFDIRCDSLASYKNRCLRKRYLEQYNDEFRQKWIEPILIQLFLKKDQNLPDLLHNHIMDINIRKLKHFLIINDNFELFGSTQCFMNLLLGNEHTKETAQFIIKSHSRSLSSDANDHQEEPQQQQEQNDKNNEDNSSSSSITSIIYVVVGVIIAFLFCLGVIVFIRRRNENGFASLTANIEVNDQQRMLKPSSGMSSVGSANNKVKQSEIQNIECKEQVISPSSVTAMAAPTQFGQVKKFSKRISAKNTNLNSEIATAIQSPISRIQGTDRLPFMGLQLEQNGGSSELVSEIGGGGGIELSSNNSKSQIESHLKNQLVKGIKAEDISVSNNLFSIDDNDEDASKVVNILGGKIEEGKEQIDYESDDTGYSNVFNLEGEESANPSSYNPQKQKQKKKKKQKGLNHLYFDDKNEE